MLMQLKKQYKIFFKKKKIFFWKKKNRDNPFALKISSQAKFYLQSQFLQPN